MLRLFDHILSKSPEYEDDDLVGFPINAILDWPMGTDAGYAMFTNPKVNAQFLKMFDVWTSFLVSPASRYVLTNTAGGWLQAIPDFVETYECDPNVEYYGFQSWDDFFTRLFRPGKRPVAPGGDNVITSACESAIYRIATDVKAQDHFWLKDQPYSLEHMLDFDPSASDFIGGTVYQAFLSALKYHRWHSPVNGKVLKTKMIPGTYYAESPVMGFDSGDPDPAAPNNSQAFITAMAARALILIKADNAQIGLMWFVAVGMAEVSTCEITVKEGERISKGDQLGMFHFGGSTHCLIFRPQTQISFLDHNVGDNVDLNAAIATVADA
jgi:phosphatidylserine decarboxylase